MENKDTILLLKECDSGSKMAVSSIDEVLENVQSTSMKQLLSESKAHHEKLGNEIHAMLSEYQIGEKEPSAMAKGISYMKTNMKMAMDKSDATVADLITDGCNMGIKSLHRYLNQYPAANHSSKAICNRLVDIEEKLCKDMREYL